MYLDPKASIVLSVLIKEKYWEVFRGIEDVAFSQARILDYVRNDKGKCEYEENRRAPARCGTLFVMRSNRLRITPEFIILRHRVILDHQSLALSVMKVRRGRRVRVRVGLHAK